MFAAKKNHRQRLLAVADSAVLKDPQFSSSSAPDTKTQHPLQQQHPQHVWRKSHIVILC